MKTLVSKTVDFNESVGRSKKGTGHLECKLYFTGSNKALKKMMKEFITDEAKLDDILEMTGVDFANVQVKMVTLEEL